MSVRVEKKNRKQKTDESELSSACVEVSPLPPFFSVLSTLTIQHITIRCAHRRAVVPS